MSLADEMRRLSEQGRKDLLYNEMEQVLKDIESAALRGENSVARFPPALLEPETIRALHSKGFDVLFSPGTKFVSDCLKISW